MGDRVLKLDEGKIVEASPGHVHAPPRHSCAQTGRAIIGVTRDVCLVDRMMSHPSNFSSASTAFPVLGSSDVHVWFCDLLHHAADQEVLAALLSGDERVRAARFAFDRDRQRFIPLMRCCACCYPATPTCMQGRSALPPARMGSRRSVVPARRLSRSSSVCPIPAHCAGGGGTRSGGWVDVEVRKADVDALKLAQRFCSTNHS